MQNNIPKVYVNNIKKINNNKEIYYSYLDKNENDFEEINHYDIQSKIDKMFKSNDFIYKKTFHIKTKYSDRDYVVISKSNNYLLTIDGERIYIENIIDIR